MENRRVKVAVWFLAITYGIGAPLTAALEYQRQLFSQRFDYPPWLIFLVCAVQVVCVGALFVRSTRLVACVVLTAITFGAIVSHVRIGSPQTAWGAVLFSGLQVWVGLKSREEHV